MSNRVAQVNQGGVSTWDVKFEIKEGKVDLQSPDREWLGRMLSENATNVPPAGITWVDSLRGLLGMFQKHVIEGTSVFYGVPLLHFLKLSVVEELVGGEKQYFFAFKTEFHDPLENEQEYVDDMYQKYGPLMVTVWKHCKGVESLLEGGDVLVAPPAPPAPAIPPLCPEPPPGGYKLSENFLKLVDANQVDNVAAAPGAPTSRALCFFVKNRNASPDNIEAWRRDSTKLANVALAVKTARDASKGANPNKAAIFDQLMGSLAALNV